MVWLLFQLWRSILAVSVLVGILYLPADIEGLPKVIQGPWEAIMSIRQQLLTAYAIITTLWILRIDLWPLLKSNSFTARFFPSADVMPRRKFTALMPRRRDTPLEVGIFYLASRKWLRPGESLCDTASLTAKRLFEASLTIRQAASEGIITVWGKKGSLWEPIPSLLWKDYALGVMEFGSAKWPSIQMTKTANEEIDLDV